MATLNLNVRPQSAPVAAQQEREVPKFWANIGYYIEVVIDGEKTLEFVSLPFGLALDGMARPAIKGKQGTKIHLVTSAQVALYDAMMEGLTSIPAGETLDVDGLGIQIRHRKDEQAPIANQATACPISFKK